MLLYFAFYGSIYALKMKTVDGITFPDIMDTNGGL